MFLRPYRHILFVLFLLLGGSISAQDQVDQKKSQSTVVKKLVDKKEAKAVTKPDANNCKSLFRSIAPL